MILNRSSTIPLGSQDGKRDDVTMLIQIANYSFWPIKEHTLSSISSQGWQTFLLPKLGKSTLVATLYSMRARYRKPRMVEHVVDVTFARRTICPSSIYDLIRRWHLPIFLNFLTWLRESGISFLRSVTYEVIVMEAVGIGKFSFVFFCFFIKWLVITAGTMKINLSYLSINRWEFICCLKFTNLKVLGTGELHAS